MKLIYGYDERERQRNSLLLSSHPVAALLIIWYLW